MTGRDKIARENREQVMKLIDCRTEEVAHRDKLDIQKSAERGRHTRKSSLKIATCIISTNAYSVCPLAGYR